MPTQEQLASQAAEALGEQSKIVQALQEQTKIAQSQADQMDPEYLRKFNEGEIKASKQFRVDLDAVLQRLKASPGSRPRSIAVTKLQEAIMWLGMDLKERNAPNPYPQSYNPSNSVVEPTADNLTL